MNFKISGKTEAMRDVDIVRQHIRDVDPELFAHAKQGLIDDDLPHSRHKDAMEAAIVKVAREMDTYEGNKSIEFRAEQYYKEFQQNPDLLSSYSATAVRG